MQNETHSGNRLSREKILRVYLNGFVCLAIIYVAWRVLEQFSPLFQRIENPFVALLITILILIVVPPLSGSLVQFVLNPILGKWDTRSELISLEERLVGELSAGGSKPVVVMAPGPAEHERIIGVMTSLFPATDQQPEMGAVDVAMAPRSKFGYVRVIPTSQLQETGWSLREFQLYQLTFGDIQFSCDLLI